MQAKLIAAALGAIAILAIVGGFYLFLQHQITAAYQNGASDAHNADAAAVDKASLDEIKAEAAARDAKQQAVLDHLAELERKQAADQQQFNASIGKLLSHDIGKDAQAHPRLVADAVNHGTARTLCLLERASGAHRDCGEAPAAGAQGAAAAAAVAQPAADHVASPH
jgi:hypothetical protein